MRKIYLVTGACGHLGNTVIRRLHQLGREIRGFDLPHESSESLRGLDVTLVRGSVCDKDSMRPLFECGEPAEFYVIHTAGIVTIASKGQDQRVYDVNVTGTKNVLELCREYGVKKLVHVSSVHAIPPAAEGTVIRETESFSPERVEGLYAKTKAEASQLVLDAARQGLPAVIVHPSGMIGPYDYGRGHLTQLVLDYLDGRLTAGVRGGYDFVDVRDVANGIISALDSEKYGECYILSGGYHSVRELLDGLHLASGRKPIRTYLPFWLATLTAPLAEAWYKMLRRPPLYTRYSLYTLKSNGIFSNEKSRSDLGFAARPLMETLRDTVEWLTRKGRTKPLHRRKQMPCVQ